MAGLVERSGVGAATIRYYLAEGLLPPPHRRAANRFVYDERHVEVLRLIRLLRSRRRLPLDAIRRLLPEMLPDLVGHPEGGVFRPEMWRQLLNPSTGGVGPTVAERLLSEGLAAFSSRGYFEVSIDDVCRAAGIAKGSFYRHFSSKEELLFAAVDAASTQLSVALAERAGAGPLPVLQLRELLEAVLMPYRTLVFDLAALASQGRDTHARSLQHFLAVLDEAVARAAGVSAELASDVVDRAFAHLVRAATEGGRRGAEAPPFGAGTR
jgi:AcrR family transcriptional regulator